MNKRIITGIVGAVILVAAVIFIVVSGAKKRTAAKVEADTKMTFNRSARPVSIETVEKVESIKERSFPGIVKASEETALSFRVDGPLTEVNVMLGEPVEQGTLLMKLDPRDFEDRVQALKAQQDGAVAVKENAKQDYDRVSELFEEKVVPQSDYDRARSSLDTADAAVKALKAQLQIAEHALKDTSLLAPYDGTVTEQLQENHEMINSGKVVLRYHNIQLLEIIVSVPENEIVQRTMKPGAKVQVSFPAIHGRKFDARLKEWSSVADKLTRSYAVTFEFDAPEGYKILPGMSANISWNETDSGATVLSVPVAALCPSGDGQSLVWVYDEEGGHAERRLVELGELKGASRVIVLSGLSEGEHIVVSGSRLIHESLALKSAATR